MRTRLLVLLLTIGALAGGQPAPATYAIQTIAGGGQLGDGGPAASALLFAPGDVAADGAGRLYIADTHHNRIRLVSTSGVITTVAGTGEAGFGGDDGPAASARLFGPRGVAVDLAGNLYIADTGNHRIRRVNQAGIIQTVAGGAAGGAPREGGLATLATLQHPHGVAVDAAGNLYIADTGHHRVRKVNTSGLISTVAGAGTPGLSGDDENAAAAELNVPMGVAVDAGGNVFIADTGNHRIRKVMPPGLIFTVATSGTPEVPGSSLAFPRGLAVDRAGNLYIADSLLHSIRLLTPGGVVRTAAGGGERGAAGDGSLATLAQLDTPGGVAVDAAGTLYIADTENHRIRRVLAGVIHTVAGRDRFSGDHGPALPAELFLPSSIALDRDGSLYVADMGNHRIRKMEPGGSITTVAGSGRRGFQDGGIATQAALLSPSAVAADLAGNLYIADAGNSRLRRVSSTGLITTLIDGFGWGAGGFEPFGVSPPVAVPNSLAVDAAGNLLLADTRFHAVRRVSPSGSITTVAGAGPSGYGGDGGPAAAALLSAPNGVALDPAQNLYIADQGNSRVRRVGAGGSIATVAGNGTFAFGGDNLPAVSAQLNRPSAVAADAAGNVYIADSLNHRIRRVSPSGVIRTIAGVEGPGLGGDGGPATLARLHFPSALAVDLAGNVYVADLLNHRIRKLTPNLPAEVRILSGDQQSGLVGRRIERPLVVRVEGTAGFPAPEVPITFAVASGSAALTATTTLTEADGAARTVVTLGQVPGPVVITAIVSGVRPARFTLNALTAGGLMAPRIVAVLGAGLSTPGVTHLAPNGIASVFGEGFAPLGSERVVQASDLVNGRLPDRLGVCVEVGGQRGRLFHLFPGQINFQVPSLSAGGEVTVQVIVNCGERDELRSNVYNAPVRSAAPEFFFLARNPDGRNPIAATHADGSPVSAGQPARPADVVTLFATGFGATRPALEAGELADRIAPTVAPVAVTVGGIPVPQRDVLYAGATPGLAGVYQVNLRIPAEAPDGELPVVVRVSEFSTPPGGFVTVRR